MEKILRKFFSMGMMSLGLLIFLIAIARATFIESAHGTQAAKAVIYNTTWFEILLIYLGVNLLVNTLRYRMYRREKLAVLCFHLAFIVILIGAGLTRYVGFEGVMPIREGKQSNIIFSSDAYLQILAHDNKTQYEVAKKLFLSDISSNDFSLDFKKPNSNDEVEINYKNFIPNAVERLKTGQAGGDVILEIVIPGEKGMDTNYVKRGGLLDKNGFQLAFENPNAPESAVQITQAPGGFEMQAPFPVSYMQMSDRAQGVISADTLFPFYQGRLYTMNGQNFVFKDFHRNAKMVKVKSPEKDMGKDVLYVEVKSGKKDTVVELVGGQSNIAEPAYFLFDGLNYKLAYGAKPVTTPFFVALRDFKLERYPGSESPSSYLSDLTVIDQEKNVQFDKRVFMNHVMDYRGYRFFQSSYDPDEKGTRLSVNQDSLGTNVTYLGYLFMALAMILSLFAPDSRFKELSRKIDGIHKKKATLLLVIALFSGHSFAQDTVQEQEHQHEVTISPQHYTAKQQKFNETPVAKEHIEKFETLLVQDMEGRIIPVHTLALEVLHKVYRQDAYKNFSCSQVFIDMLINPNYWMDQPIILVSDKEVQKALGMNDKYATFRSFFNEKTGEYRLQREVEIALQKPAKKQNELDKQFIKVNERVQVMNMVFLYRFFKIIPIKNAPNNTWYTPMDEDAPYHNEDSLVPRMVISYLTYVVSGKMRGDYSKADEWLTNIKTYQRYVAKGIAPSETKVKMEVSYNKLNLFANLSNAYLITGFLLLLIFFVRVFTTNIQWTNLPNKIITFAMLCVFVVHGIGLGMRWYISGHAPWSDGYEAIVFIAWVCVMAGFFFSGKSKATLGGTALLAFFMLFVAHLNQLDPQITNLVPVLKSYWLMIHVAIITGSYGFLGLGAILAIINLFLYVFRTTKNGKLVTLNINEVSYVSEMAITVGLFMLTTGTFLGGVWANESWGRYWGWDPKETWALVSILAYAIVLHLRFIPKLDGKFVFNSATMWAFSMILFTFFGVNFFLVGLHSYANGEADKMWPTWVLVTICCFVAFNLLAAWRNHQFKSAQEKSK